MTTITDILSAIDSGYEAAQTVPIRNLLATAKVAIIEYPDLYFIMPDGEQVEIGQFEAYTLLAHALGIEIDWEATE